MSDSSCPIRISVNFTLLLSCKPDNRQARTDSQKIGYQVPPGSRSAWDGNLVEFVRGGKKHAKRDTDNHTDAYFEFSAESKIAKQEYD
jgi:hypothetical protein